MNNFFGLLLVKVYANLRTEVSRYYLNYLWWLIEPILTMGTYYLVFGIFLSSKVEHFVPFLLIGLVSWQWFSHCVDHASSSIVGGKGLMLQVNIPKVFFPLEVIFRGTFKSLFVFFMLLLFLVFYPLPVTKTWFALPVLMLVEFLFILGFSIICAMIVPFIPDLKLVISSLLRLVMFGSGVFYNIDSVVLPQHRALLYVNPMAGLLINYREILMYGRWPDWTYLSYLAVCGVVLVLIAVSILFKLDHIYPRVCQK